MSAMWYYTPNIYCTMCKYQINKGNTKTNQNKKTPTTKSISNIGRYKKITHNKKCTLMCISNTMNIKKRI